MTENNQDIVVVALYKFVALPDFEELREPLLDFCQSQGIKGTLLLAHEGINGTVSGSRVATEALIEYLRSDTRLSDIEYKESFYSEQPFLSNES